MLQPLSEMRLYKFVISSFSLADNIITARTAIKAVRAVSVFFSCLLSFYFSISAQNRMNIAAIWARVALSLGARVPSAIPVMIPCMVIQCMASSA